MEECYYGWIKKSKYKKTKIRSNITKTGEYFCAYFKGEKAEKYTDIRAKNLYSKCDKIYYILSIGRGKTMWAPYPFIKDINQKKQLCMVLTVDTDDNTGEVWILDFKPGDISDGNNDCLSLSGVEIKKNIRRDAGDYYSLSRNKVIEIREKQGKNKEADYHFEMNNTSDNEKSIKRIVEKILNRGNE